MTHLEEGRLQAYMDGEMLLDERRRAELHLQECDGCRRELEAANARAGHFATAMAVLDLAPLRREHAIGWPRRSRWAGARRHLPRAAVLLLFVAGGAAAAVPGSPLRSWLVDVAGVAPATAPGVPAAAPVAESAPAASESVEAGVSVEAENGSVQVLVHDAARVRIRARLVEGTRAGAYALGGAAESRFLTGAGRIEVLSPADGELRLEIPRGSATVSVKINDSEVLRIHDADLDLSARDPSLAAAGVTFSVEP